MLWPDSRLWPRDGEIDFPERNLLSRRDGLRSPARRTSRQRSGVGERAVRLDHVGTTTVIEWSPNLSSSPSNGVEVDVSRNESPKRPLHWVLQTETTLTSTVPPVVPQATSRSTGLRVAVRPGRGPHRQRVAEAPSPVVTSARPIVADRWLPPIRATREPRRSPAARLPQLDVPGHQVGARERRSPLVAGAGFVSHLTWQSRQCVAVTMTVVALTGCGGEGRTDRTAEVEVSQPVDSTMTADVDVAIDSSVAAPTMSSEEDGGDAAAAEFTRSLFADLRGNEPGCTVAVGRGGAVVFAEAYGAARLDPFEPMTVDTVVDIASVSKQFTATAILLLAERGAVDLDAPLSTYVPDLPSWASRPTVAQLIHHESGIPDYIDLLVERGFTMTGSSPTIADALAALGDVVDLRFAPERRGSTSNSNYFLLSQVVVAVTGDDLGAFLATEVFVPLGLDMVMDPIAAIEDKAVSYQRVGGEWQVADVRWEPTIGAGSIQTTPSQLVAWAAQYWEPTIGATTIDAERFEAAVDAGQGMRYGAGMFEGNIGGDVGRILAHTGRWGGFFTRFFLAPAHRVAVAVSCTSPTAIGDSYTATRSSAICSPRGSAALEPALLFRNALKAPCACARPRARVRTARPTVPPWA